MLAWNTFPILYSWFCREPVFFEAKRIILLRWCHWSVWAHPTNNTEYDTTNATPTHSPRIIAEPHPLEYVQVESARFPMLPVMELTIWLKTCEAGIWARPSTSREYGTTNAIFIHVPTMIPCNTSTAIHKTRIHKRNHIFTDETNDIAQNMRSWHLSAPKQQHSIRHN